MTEKELAERVVKNLRSEDNQTEVFIDPLTIMSLLGLLIQLWQLLKPIIKARCDARKAEQIIQIAQKPTPGNRLLVMHQARKLLREQGRTDVSAVQLTRACFKTVADTTAEEIRAVYEQ